jgi:hypothetical protein
MHVVVGEPMAAREFIRDNEAPVRTARRITQWMLTQFDAGQTTQRGHADATGLPWLAEPAQQSSIR